MPDAVVSRAASPGRVEPWAIAVIPVGLAAAGLLLRYFAYAMTVPDAAPAGFADALCQWDCESYANIVSSGYDIFPLGRMTAARNWAFFPLLPLLAGAIHQATGLSAIVAGMALSTLASIAACWLAWPLLQRNLRAYTLFAAYLLCGPFSVYFTTLYTEGLFVFLTVAVFAALRQRQFLLAGGLAALLSATRIVGVFIILAILVELWLAHRQRGGTPAGFIPALWCAPEQLLALLVAPLGLLAYMTFLHVQVGDALAFAHVQRGWNREVGNPLLLAWQAVTAPDPSGRIPPTGLVLTVSTLGGYALTLVLLLRRRFGMALFCLAAITLPLFSGVISMLRFVAGLAPVPLLLAELLSGSRAGFVAALVLLVAGDYFITVAWLTRNLALA